MANNNFSNKSAEKLRYIMWGIYRRFSRTTLSHIIPDKQHLKNCYSLIFGRKLNLDNPQSYNEKIQWLKLYDRNPLYPLLVDKYEAKKLVAEKIGEKYIIPTLGVWEKFDDINFDELPDKFVLKCTHDSGGLVICPDKSKLDKAVAKKKIEKSLKRNFFWWGREWVYKDIKPRIIAEKFMVDDSGFELKDYKFICFNGVPQVVLIASGRYMGEKQINYLDMDFNLLPVGVKGTSAENNLPVPKSFDEMKKLAAILSNGITNVRADFYEIDGQPYFGELTFSDGCGLDPFSPDEFDFTLGSKMILPDKNELLIKNSSINNKNN